MLKKTIEYVDYNGNKRTDDFYFHLSTSKLAELELTSPDGGFMETLQKIAKSKDGGEIIGMFKKILSLSYGVKSEDGARFHQTDELWEDFTASPAFDKLFLELITKENAAVEFVNGIMPSDMAQTVEELEGAGLVEAKIPEKEIPLYQQENRDPTKKELSAMSNAELQEAFGWKMRDKD